MGKKIFKDGSVEKRWATLHQWKKFNWGANDEKLFEDGTIEKDGQFSIQGKKFKWGERGESVRRWKY